MAITIFEPRHEVWHKDDEGDWGVAYFDLPLPITPDRVMKMFQETVKKWAVMQEAEGFIPTTKPVLNPGVFFCPEPDKLDHRRFYIAARFKKEKPDLLPIDTVAQLAAADVESGAKVKDFYEQMHGFRTDVADPNELDAQVKENESLPARAEAEREAKERLDWRLTHRPSP